MLSLKMKLEVLGRPDVDIPVVMSGNCLVFLMGL